MFTRQVLTYRIIHDDPLNSCPSSSKSQGPTAQRSRARPRMLLWKGSGLFPRGRAALMLPATNPLSKVLTLFPVPRFPRGPHFPLSLGNGPAQIAEVCSPRAGAPPRLLADLRLPPLTSLLRCVPLVHLPTSPSLSQNPSSTSEKRWGLFRLCCGFITGPLCGPCQHRLLWASASLCMGRKVGRVGSMRLDGVPKRVHPRFVLQVGLFCYSWA